MLATPCSDDPDGVAEAYCLKVLDAADAAAFEEHLLVCGECRATVDAVAEYVRAIRTAAERMRTDPEAR
jgi:predicted anti-sigma-YlaC factor YlaD